MRVSVITPTYNKADYLAKTLASFRRQTVDDYEIVVVDDGSSDHTQAVLARYREHLPLKVITHTNRGRAASRNAAFDAAEGDILLMSDDDRIVVADFVEQHIKAHEQAEKPSFVVGAACGVISHLHAGLASTPQAARAIDEASVAFFNDSDVLERFDACVVARSFPEPTWHVISQQAFADYDEVVADVSAGWFLVYSGNMSVPRGGALEAGGFDRAFTGWGFEDTEFGYRMAQVGLASRVSTSAVSYHQWHPRDWDPARMRRNAQFFLDKHDTFEVQLFIHWLSTLWGDGTPLPFRTLATLITAARAQPDLAGAMSHMLHQGPRNALDALIQSVESFVS